MTAEELEGHSWVKTMDEFERSHADAQDGWIEGADMAALRQLQTEERDLAVATTECSQLEQAVYQEVYADVEAAYMAENEDRIAAAVAELEQEPAPSSP